jgi:predicted negative regulator of RcsB-dependent stress response
MAKHLDLEEQEQLAEIKHFWNEYGNLITWVVIAVFGSIAAWNGWQYWQRTQGVQAAAMYDEVERAAAAGDVERVERAFSDMKDKFGRTMYAQQAGLLAARTMVEKGNNEGAKAALAWVADKSADEGYQALARLRLAALLLEAKAYDEALKQLASGFPREFEGLAADRRGDVYAAQGKKAEAKAEYTKAYKTMDERTEYRRLVEVKLSALGVDPQQLAAPAATAASGGAKP